MVVMEGTSWVKGGWEHTLRCGGSLHSRGAGCTRLPLDFWYIVLSRSVLLAFVFEYYIPVSTVKVACRVGPVFCYNSLLV